MKNHSTRSRVAGKASLIFSCFLIFVASVATAQAANSGKKPPMEFALIGDMPYGPAQDKQFANVMKAIDAANLAFVVHVGDFQSDGIIWKQDSEGFPPCADATFQDRFGLAQKSKHPFIFTPGDNDWTDCYRAKPRTYEPLERLAKLRQMFYPDDLSLGQTKLRLSRQSAGPNYAKFRENAQWTYGNVLFVTLHMVGSNNNFGRTAEMDKEYAERNAANIEWLRQAFEQAKKNGNRALMILAQANPQFETTWTPQAQTRYMLGGLGIAPPNEKRSTGFDDFVAALEKETLAYGRPVVYAHGDTHTFRVDKPLLGSKSGRIIDNFTRVETFGAPDSHWVRITIDPADPNVFRFQPEIIQENRATH